VARKQRQRQQGVRACALAAPPGLTCRSLAENQPLMAITVILERSAGSGWASCRGVAPPAPPPGVPAAGEERVPVDLRNLPRRVVEASGMGVSPAAAWAEGVLGA
jgi:hypothetical protein